MSKRPLNTLVALPLLVALFIAGGMTYGAARNNMRVKGSTMPIRPTVPTANRNDGSRIFLERADRLDAQDGLPYQILTGNVEFRKQGMYMYCDSAHFNDLDRMMEAFGNVRMQQGDTLFIYADRLLYNDSLQLATLYSDYGEDVRLINRDVELRTIEFNYDLGIDLGYYEYGGTIIDTKNRLTSQYGEYSPSSKEAVFGGNVHLVSRKKADDGQPSLEIRSDSLYYSTLTHIAVINVPAVITSPDGVIHTDNGSYNTDADTTVLYNRSLVVANNGNTLTADTLFYDRASGYGVGRGNVVINDTTNHVLLRGGYGYYSEIQDSAVVTHRALAIEYSRPDSLFLHGDTIRSLRVITPGLPADSLSVAGDSLTVAVPDTTHHVIAAPRVRFWRTDVQGLCDSMIFVQRDSVLHMHRHPIVWSDNKQVFGNIIQIHLNDSTVDWMKLPSMAFTAEEIEPGYYNQLSGKEMLALMDNGHLRHLDVSGNVEFIMLPMENDSTYNKIANGTSSYMAADFDNDNIQRLKTWPETNGTFTPLYLAKKSLFFLPKFKWYEPLRPTGPYDVFNVSQEMIDLLESPEDGVANNAGTLPGSPAPVPLAAEPETPDGEAVKPEDGLTVHEVEERANHENGNTD